MTVPFAIETEGLTKRFGGVTAIADVNLGVGSGEVFGLLGPNGAGKSTTIDLLLGLTTPTDGTVGVFGTDVARDPRTVRERLGVLPENYAIYEGMTGRENLTAMLRLGDADDDPDRLREAVGLSREAFDRPAGGYSKGMQQRLVLAIALAGDPDLLVLDEPMSGLDPEGIELVREVIRERADAGTTVFFSSHRLAEVEAVCDRVGIMNEGRLVSVGDVDALTRTGAMQRLHLSLADSPETDLLDRVRALADVSDVSPEGRSLTVACTTAGAKADVIEQVNRACSVRDFEVEEAALEDVFDATLADDRTTRSSESESSRVDSSASDPSDATASASTDAVTCPDGGQSE